MNLDILHPSISQDDDVEAQTWSRIPGEKGPRRVHETGDKDTTEPIGVLQDNIASPRSDPFPSNDQSAAPEWRPWKADEPLRTWVEDSPTTVKDWVKAMDASDSGMCKGWTDQIDTLIIFAGLFSATVTAFTVESYKWLSETPADTLARLQLRDRLNATHDPAMDRLAPAAFNVDSTLVAINTLWFTSLTLSLAAVVISILCRQWLYEYQRYDNFTTDEAFLIRGLRHRGLQAWKVPDIIAFLPILLQVALISFLVGILVLLWPLQSVVASIITIIVGLIFLFLVVTTALPSIQYIFPIFDTQCPYKSSQSWSFFLISAFWRFNFSEFTSWASIDRWEVTHVYSGLGHTLSRVYKLLWNNADTVLNVYNTLATKSLKPAVNEDLTLLSDFVDGLDTSQKQIMGVRPPDPKSEDLKTLRRAEQLKGCFSPPWYRHERRVRPGTGNYNRFSSRGVHFIQKAITYGYHLTAQRMLNKFLRSTNHISHPALFNRYIEHWARSLDVEGERRKGGAVCPSWDMYSSHIPYDPDIAIYLVDLHIHLFKTDQIMAHMTVPLLHEAYPNLLKSYNQYKYHPRYERSTPPVTLLQALQEWVDQVPESDLLTKTFYAENILFGLAVTDEFLGDFSRLHTSNLEKQYLLSFARFFVHLYEREDFSKIVQERGFSQTEPALAFLREYLEQNQTISS